MNPPMEQKGDSTACESQRSIPPLFVSKTYKLVDDHNVDDVISWNDAGSSFIVWEPTVLARDLLPKYFNHNNFTSFLRQLSYYRFRKVRPDRLEFSHECFRRGKKQLLCEIQRRKIQAPSPAELLEENERLRKENFKLNKELEEMRSLHKNISNLILNHARENDYTAAETSHLMPTRRCSGEDEAAMVVEEDKNPKLFGLANRVKRAREDDTVLGLHQPGHAKVKSEPFD